MLEILEIPLINCKVEFKLNGRSILLCAAGDDDDDDDDDNIILTIKDKLYVPVVTLSVRDNQKLSKLFGKGFEISIYRNECNTKKRE